MADGDEVDWQEIERRLAEGPEAGRISALRLVQELSSSGLAPASQQVDRIPLSLRALLALVGIQAIFALIGAALGDSATIKVVPQEPVLATMISFAAAGILLCAIGRRDRRALSLAGFFLCVASATAQRFLGLLPRNPAFVLLPAFLPEAFLPFFLWRFAGEFPRTLRLDRWDPWIREAARLSGPVGLFLFLVNAFDRLALGQVGPMLAPFLRAPKSLYWLLIFSLCLPAPIVAWLRSRRSSAEERRRVRWFLAGIAAGILPLFSVVLAEILVPGFSRWMSTAERRYWIAFPLLGMLCTIPVTTTYAVTAHRLLTVRVALRNAARLALARGSLLALAVIPSAVLVRHLYGRRALPLAALLTERSVLVLAASAALGWLLYSARKPVFRRLEDLLVGRRREPSWVIAEFGRDARNVRTPAELARMIRERVAQLVAADQSTLLLLDADQGFYLDVERRLRPLPVTTGLARLAAAAPEPFLLGEEERDSLSRWLTEEDRQWITDAEADLAAPLLGSQGEVAGILILGPTRGGLAYGRAEQLAVSALATGAAVALERVGAQRERSPGRALQDEPAGECRRCGRVAPQTEGACTCGGQLVPAVIPYELGGKFRLESVLGQGGMGVVYRATDLALDRPVALKTLPHLSADALSRLRREARSMAGFLHPNLALIFGAETWRGVPVLVVEYLAGGTLAARLRHGALAPEEVVRLGADLAGALEAMHRKGLLHRDVKPSNIGFTEEGVPKLLDFGLAHLVEEARLDLGRPASDLSSHDDRRSLRMTGTGQIVGTPLYLSPEVLGGAPPSPAQDLWALHLVLWEALAGRHPCAGLPWGAALRQLSKGEIPDLRKTAPECPLVIAELITRGLEANFRQRTSTAPAVRDAFSSMIG